MIKRAALIFMMVVLCAPLAFCANPATMINEGNRRYQAQRYQEAAEAYERAQELEPDSAMVHFNLGTALFKTKDFAKAKEAFEKALLLEQKKLRAKAYYNLGNTNVELAQQKEQAALPEAITLMEQAVYDYKKAMEADVHDEDAKVNYELARKKLDELKEKLANQPQQQEQQNQQQGEDQDKEHSQQQQQGQDKQDQPQQKQSQGQKQNQPDARRDNGDTSGPEPSKETSSEKNKNDRPEQSNEGSKKPDEPAVGVAQDQVDNRQEMSEQEAVMLLNGFRDEENALGKIDDQRKAQDDDVVKDW
ncbi:MAG: tetratricopeptide repeat protein [Candidatus Omnitrophica bacterium]|nr:tetratricopeptide repeat protein [Candidatus Omnitrophota bacterium]